MFFSVGHLQIEGMDDDDYENEKQQYRVDDINRVENQQH